MVKLNAAGVLGLTAGFVGLATATYNLPVNTVYGVNLGSMFIIEPWMLPNEWASMGGSGSCSEFDLWSKNLPGTPAAFKKHWETWVTIDDIYNLVYDYGINTFRIPLGYWIVEELTYYGDGSGREPFPLGGYPYLLRVLSWIKGAGANAILVLHGAPGGQVNNAFTGQCNPNPGFYNSYNYGRALKWARNMTRLAHNEGKGVVIGIEAVNEPETDPAKTPGLGQYYTDFANAVRDEESKMGVQCGPTSVGVKPYNDCVNLVFMDNHWQWGNHANPADSCRGHCIYDDHNYACFGGPPSQSLAGYKSWFCNDNRLDQNAQARNTPTITMEWSLCNNFGASVSDMTTIAKQQMYKYTSGSAAKGWMFWNFKVENRGKDWDYRSAVDAGIMPKQPGNGDAAACR
ncbi:hypothetical protein HK104_007873 [Borealophlyctis nickersoniae]|nr:hypothetical protein HK104_007873 [Borealophlyctis nickersoniae]